MLLAKPSVRSRHPAVTIERRLRFNLPCRSKIGQPALRRTAPELDFRHQLIALPGCAHTDAIDLRAISDGAGKNGRPAFGAKGLRPLGATFTGLDVNFRLA